VVAVVGLRWQAWRCLRAGGYEENSGWRGEQAEEQFSWKRKRREAVKKREGSMTARHREGFTAKEETSNSRVRGQRKYSSGIAARAQS